MMRYRWWGGAEMNEKDKVLFKDTSLIVIDQVVDNIPGLGFAWKLCKALIGAGLKLRQNRALEWVEMIRDNPSEFSHEILSSEPFQDGFVYSLEKYIIERSDEKRKIFRNIFLGFARNMDKNNYPMEKYYHTLAQLSAVDIVVLKDVDTKQHGLNYQIYGNANKNLDNIFSLINEGLLIMDSSSRIGPINAPFVKISLYGKEFVEFLKK